MKKEKFEGFLIVLSVLVVFLLLLSEQARAVRVGVVISGASVYEGNTVSFIAYVDIDDNERIPVESITVAIGSSSCIFDAGGNELSGALCSNITITVNSARNYTTGARWGYDYETMVNRTFASGYGYGYQPGYSTSASPYGELSYTIEWTAPDVDSDTTYDVVVTATANSTVTYSKTYSNLITVRNIADSTSSSGSSGSSRSSSTSTTPAPVSRVWIFGIIDKGKPLTANYQNIGIGSITLYASDQMKNVKLTVAKLDAPPANEYAGTVYQYYEISVPPVSQQNMEKAIITFEVTKAWLDERGFSKDRIILTRYAGGKWVELATRFVSQGGDKYVFEAETPGFSYFAVSVKPDVPAATAKVPEVIAPAPEPAAEPEQVLEYPPPVASEQDAEPNAKNGPFALLLLTIIAGALGVYLFAVSRKAAKIKEQSRIDKSIGELENKIKDMKQTHRKKKKL